MSLTYVSGTLLAQGNILRITMTILFPSISTSRYLSIHQFFILKKYNYHKDIPHRIPFQYYPSQTVPLFKCTTSSPSLATYEMRTLLGYKMCNLVVSLVLLHQRFDSPRWLLPIYVEIACLCLSPSIQFLLS